MDIDLYLVVKVLLSCMRLRLLHFLWHFFQYDGHCIHNQFLRKNKCSVWVAYVFADVVVKAACLEKLPAWKVRDRGLEPHSGFQVQRNKMFLPRLLVKIQYCGEPLCPKDSVLGLRPPGLEFRIMCLDHSVISFMSPSSASSPGPV